MGGGAIEGVGELDSRDTCLFRQRHQSRGLGHVTAFDIEGMLDELDQRPGQFRGEPAGHHQGAASGLGVVDKALGQRAVKAEGLAGGPVDRLPMLEDVAPGMAIQSRTLTGTQAARHQVQRHARRRGLRGQGLDHRGKTPAPGTQRVHHIEQAGLGHTQFSIA
ncbi:hypothetical protein D9M71_507550 [compost metagenome]